MLQVYKYKKKEKNEISSIVVDLSRSTLAQQWTDREYLCICRRAIRHHFLSPPDLPYIICRRVESCGQNFLYAHMCIYIYIYIYIGSWSIFFLLSVYLYEVTNSAEGHTYTLPVLLSSSSFFTCIISIFELLTSTTVIQNGETIHYVVHLSLVPIYVI